MVRLDAAGAVAADVGPRRGRGSLYNRPQRVEAIVEITCE